MAMILLIDDDGFYRGVIRPILEDGGHQVIEASNGVEGLEIYRTHRPVLVITDMRMPGVGGTEVITSPPQNKSPRKDRRGFRHLGVLQRGPFPARQRGRG